MQPQGRTYVQFKLKDLISKSGVKLIELSFQHTSGIDLHYVRMGEVGLYYNPGEYDEDSILAIFRDLGFDVLSDPEDELVERIRIAAIELIQYANNVNSLIRNSDYISERLEMPYDKLSRIYSKKCGKTLETYLIQLKIEKAKELLTQSTLSTAQIAYSLGFEHPQSFNKLFKQKTRLSPTTFRQLLH